MNFRIPLLLSIGLYVFSLFLPVYSEHEIPGYMALLGGWMTGLNDIPTAVSWLANVTFFFGIVLILKRKKPRPFGALILGIFSLLFGLAVLAAGKAFTGASEIMAKSSMSTAFYAWIGSFILFIIAAWMKFKKR